MSRTDAHSMTEQERSEHQHRPYRIVGYEHRGRAMVPIFRRTQPVPDVSIAEIANALSSVYEGDGVAIWLGAANKLLRGERAIDVCRTAEGRERVLALVDALAGGAYL